MTFSVIIPCYQNESQLATTVQRIVDVFDQLPGHAVEILLVDDGSTDATWNKICQLSQQFEVVSGFRLASNVGAYIALTVGFDHAKGDTFLVMAADGDDPPELIPELIARYRSTTDAVLAVRSGTGKGFVSTFLSHTFYTLLRVAGARNVPQYGSDFMLFSGRLLTPCREQGWLQGNTLIQLLQHADRIDHFIYRKGNSRKSTWSFKKRVALFVDTLRQFFPLKAPLIAPQPQVKERTDR